MRWFKKEIAGVESSFQGDFISPVTLDVALDPDICRQKIDKLFAYSMSLNVDVAQLIAPLNEKHLLFSQLLRIEVIDGLQFSQLQQLMNSNRELIAYFNAVPLPLIRSKLKMLLCGEAELSYRMNRFSASFDDALNPKLATAIWDFMAELLHFSKPETYPLMSRWVWHAKSQKGVMKEFLSEGSDCCYRSLGSQSVDFEAYRVWFAQQLGKKGLFQDVHYYIDLIVAQAYADYILSISSSCKVQNTLVSDSFTSLGIIAKLLGVEFNAEKLADVQRGVTLH